MSFSSLYERVYGAVPPYVGDECAARTGESHFTIATIPQPPSPSGAGTFTATYGRSMSCNDDGHRS